MTREETQELCELSIECFGRPYEWRKLRRKGLVVGHDKETGYKRRIPLTVEQTKQYMVKTLEMRKAAREEHESRTDSNGTSNEGQSPAREDNGASE